MLQSFRPDSGDAAPFGLENFNGQAVELEGLPDVRHPSDVCEQIAADRLIPLALDVDFQPFGELAHMCASAEDEAAIALFENGLDFDVVFVTNLANDLFEQIFDRDEPRRAAIFIDDDGGLHPLALKFPEQLRYPLGFRHKVGGTNQWRYRLRQIRRVEEDQVLDRDQPNDVVERFVI